MDHNQNRIKMKLQVMCRRRVITEANNAFQNYVKHLGGHGNQLDSWLAESVGGMNTCGLQVNLLLWPQPAVPLQSGRWR